MWMTIWRRIYVRLRRLAKQPRVTKWWFRIKTLLFQIFMIDTPRLQTESKAPRNGEQWWFAALFRANCLHCRAFTTQKTEPISGKSICGSKKLWGGRLGVIFILKQLLPNHKTGKLGVWFVAQNEISNKRGGKRLNIARYPQNNLKIPKRGLYF